MEFLNILKVISHRSNTFWRILGLLSNEELIVEKGSFSINYSLLIDENFKVNENNFIFTSMTNIIHFQAKLGFPNDTQSLSAIFFWVFNARSRTLSRFEYHDNPDLWIHDPEQTKKIRVWGVQYLKLINIIGSQYKNEAVVDVHHSLRNWLYISIALCPLRTPVNA